MAAPEPSASLWLEAHEDPWAGLRTCPGCMVLADVHGDGDHKLVVGVPLSAPPRLAVVRGAGALSSLPLPDPPCGLGVFGSSQSDLGGTGGGPGGGGAPLLVVASGPSLYVYRNLRPFYKYSLPPRDPPQALEKELWAQAGQDQIDPLMLKEMLEDLRDKAQVPLTARSLRLLSLPPPELGPFVEQYKGRALQQQPVLTCLGALPRGGPEGAPQCPILGTEDGDLLVLDPEAFTPLCQGWVPSPPAFVTPRGAGDNRWRLAAACRDGNLYGVHRTRPRGRRLASLGSAPLGLLSLDWGLLAATAGALRGFSHQGRRLWVLPLPGGVTALAGGVLAGQGVGAALVALETPTPQIRLYRGRSLLCIINTQEVVTGLCFGRYGREDNTLLATTRGGALSIRMLRRRAELGGGTHGGCPTPTSGPSDPKGSRLPLPPRTRLFVDGALREREGATAMHRRFQQDLGGLRLGAARGLAKALLGGGTVAETPPGGTATGISLTATVQGLGPSLRLSLRLLLPGGSPPAPHLLLLLRCRPLPRRLHPPCIKVPLLLPGLCYEVGTWLEPGEGPQGLLQVLLLRPGLEAPLLAAQIRLGTG